MIWDNIRNRRAARQRGNRRIPGRGKAKARIEAGLSRFTFIFGRSGVNRLPFLRPLIPWPLLLLGRAQSLHLALL